MTNFPRENWQQHWVLVADNARARLFRMTGAKTGLPTDLEEIEDVAHPEARLKEKDLVTDAPGRTGETGRTQRHTFSTENSEKEHERHLFGVRLCDHLDSLRASSKLAKLDIVAEPKFLGELRKGMSSKLAACVQRTVSQRAADLDGKEIMRLLREEGREEG